MLDTLMRDALRPPGLQAAIVTSVMAVLVTSAAAQSGSTSSDAETFVGVYELGDYEAHGDQPTGRISYDAAGRMWAMLAPPGREPISDTSTPEQYRAAMSGLVAYYGTYEVDTATDRVIHHVEAASNPAWVGDDFVRWYRFEDGDLILSLNPEFDNPLLWERLPSP